MPLSYLHYDVFTGEPLLGNQLAGQFIVVLIRCRHPSLPILTIRSR